MPAGGQTACVRYLSSVTRRMGQQAVLFHRHLKGSDKNHCDKAQLNKSISSYMFYASLQEGAGDSILTGHSVSLFIICLWCTNNDTWPIGKSRWMFEFWAKCLYKLERLIWEFVTLKNNNMHQTCQHKSVIYDNVNNQDFVFWACVCWPMECISNLTVFGQALWNNERVVHNETNYLFRRLPLFLSI